MTIRNLFILAAISFALVLSACQSQRGANTVSPSGYAYNEAIAQTKSEQLLLNLVRLKYRDPVVFMDIDGVTTQHQYAASFSAENLIPFRNASDGSSLLIPGASVSETPTIVYTPLDSSQFAQDLLAPIAPESMILLANSGWSIERLLACCVERLGPLSNSPSVSGPTPARIPDNSKYRRAATLIRELQQKEQARLQRLPDKTGDSTSAFLVINADQGEMCAELMELLATTSCDMQIKLVSKAAVLRDDAPIMRTRTVLGALYTLSHAVSVPSSHRDIGLATPVNATGALTPDWQTFLSNLFEIRSDESEPTGAAVRVFFRDHWYWVADNDLDSKTTFNLVMFLLTLQSAASDGVSPLLTINAGG